MKKIKDFSKTIGLIRRGGLFSPSNERSEEKLRAMLIDLHKVNIPPQLIFNAKDYEFLHGHARKLGYRLMVIERGLGR